MLKDFRQRIIFLVLSVIIMVILFVWNVNRSSERSLPPTPTNATGEMQLSPLASTSTKPIAETKTPEVSTTPQSEIELTLDAAREQANQEATKADIQTATALAYIQSTIDANLGGATARAQFMGNKIKSLNYEGAISSTDGIYYKVPDFENYYNKMGWFLWWFTEYQPEDFVLRTEILWETATMEDVSWNASGCGFMFGTIDMENHFRVFLSLDGIVRLHRMIEGEFSILEAAYYGELNLPAGHAQMILIVEDGWISIYINNIQVMRVYDENISKGYIAHTVSSGTNINFGTRCQMLDTELWEFK